MWPVVIFLGFFGTLLLFAAAASWFRVARDTPGDAQQVLSVHRVRSAAFVTALSFVLIGIAVIAAGIELLG